MSNTTVREAEKILTKKLVNEFGDHPSFYKTSILSVISILLYAGKVKFNGLSVLREELSEDLYMAIINKYSRGY